MSSIEKAMQRQAEKKKFGQKAKETEEAKDESIKTNDETSIEKADKLVKSQTQESTTDATESASVESGQIENVSVDKDVAPTNASPDEPTADNNVETSDPQAQSQGESKGEIESDGAQAADLNEPVEVEDPLLPVSKDLFIDTTVLEDKGFVALSKKRTLINEEFRSIKRKVLNTAFGPLAKTLKHSNLVLVSSSRPNEGKTFSAVNLALSIALEQDKKVLLVDADVLKPSISKTLNIGANVGLIEYLTGEVPDVGDVMYHTNIENLKVLPAGLPHHLSNELLSSDKMQKLFEEFATRYPDRIVVFDCPPLLGVNETALMAAQCGQGVIVVEELRSKVSEVKKATELLPEEMAVGFVLNKVVETNTADSYGYGYYYSTGE